MLEPGRKLLHYQVGARIGAGGMGEVWRATDTSLDREVAIKILPGEVADVPERLARFEREARLLATLSHPGIAAIYGLHQSDGIHFLAMEYVEGEDLSARLARGPLTLHDAVDAARQIAEALASAHERGVIHRDLKPANVKVTGDGTVKVLDFGLAKAVDPASGTSSPSMSLSPTMTAAATRDGIILGTAAYMSPEQARGKPVDRRTDIWAFGCLLYEMLTGERLFQGDTVSDVLASVLRSEPDWDRLPQATPRQVRRLLSRCLEREAQRRLHHMADARIELEDALAGRGAGGAEAEGVPAAALDPAAGGAVARTWMGRWFVAAAALAVGLAAGWLLTGGGAAAIPAAPAPLLRVELSAPAGTTLDMDTTPGAATLSPDGTRLVFGARSNEDGIERLYVRDLADGDARFLPGTEYAQYPFWGPDSRWLAFFVGVRSGGGVTAGGKLQKLNTDGGPALTVCDALNGKGGTWNRAGIILFAPTFGSAIHQVPAVGGEPRAVTSIDTRSHNSHRHPRFLADGRRFIFLARSNTPGQPSDIMLADLDGGEPRRLMTSVTQAEPLEEYLIFARGQTVLAAPFNTAAGSLVGEALPVAEGVLVVAGASFAALSAAGPHLAHNIGSPELPSTLVWIDRSGQQLATAGEPAFISSVELSPDGRTAALGLSDGPGGSLEIWTQDMETGRRTRLTTEAGDQGWIAWGPDSRTIYYASNHDSGVFNIYRRTLGSLEPAAVVVAGSENIYPEAVTPDGAWLLYRRQETGGGDIWRQRLGGDTAEPETVLQAGTAIEIAAALSPDGHLLAYQSSESGRDEIYITDYPGISRRWQVSGGGGRFPVWGRDGRELLFENLAGGLAASRVEGEGESLRAGLPEVLFTMPPRLFEIGARVAPGMNGQRLLGIHFPERSQDARIGLTLNWRGALAR